jgi:hypothetical protein
VTHEEIGLDDLRAAWAARRGAADDCPADEALWEAARGEAGAAAARRVALHLSRCPACTDGWRLARDLGTTPLPARAARAGGPTLGWWALAAAAGVATVALMSLEVADRVRPPSAPAVRAPEAAAVRSMLPPGEPLARADCVLRWSGPEHARYDVRVAREDLALLASALALEATEYRVPPESLADLPPGARIVWQVKGTLPDGAPLAPATFVATLE